MQLTNISRSSVTRSLHYQVNQICLTADIIVYPTTSGGWSLVSLSLNHRCTYSQWCKPQTKDVNCLKTEFLFSCTVVFSEGQVEGISTWTPWINLKLTKRQFMPEQDPFTRLTGAGYLEAFAQNAESPVPTHPKSSYTETLKHASKQNRSKIKVTNECLIFHLFFILSEIKYIVTTLQQTFSECFSLYVFHFVSKWTVHPLINKGEKHSTEVRAVIKSTQVWILWWDRGPPPFAKILCVILGKSLCNSLVSMVIFLLHCLYIYWRQNEWITSTVLMFK